MEARLAVLEASIPRIEAAMQKIAQGIESLARLESSHQAMSEGLGRAFKAIEALEELANQRLEKIEGEMPTLKLARNVILAFAGLCMTVVIGFIMYKVGLLVSTGVKLP